MELELELESSLSSSDEEPAVGLGEELPVGLRGVREEDGF